MKTMKKLASAALALVMALCLTVPAFAVDAGEGGAGKITVTNPAPEQTYKLYRIFDLAYGGSTDGNSDAAHTYTVNTAWADFINQETIKGVYVDVDEQGYVTWHQNEVEGKKENADAAEFAKLALAWAENEDGTNKNGITPIASAIAGTAAEPTAETPDPRAAAIEFTGLNLGYYLISSTRGTLCALDSTNKTASVTEKNEKPTVEKEATKLPEGIGSKVEYQVTIHAKKGAEKYVLHDTMTKGLSFNNDVEVTVGDTIVDSSNYTVKTADFAEGHTCTFEVIFTQNYLNTLTADTTDIVISYSATVNAEAVEVDTVTNTAKLSYGNEEAPEETLPDPVEIPLYQFDLVKTNSDDMGKEVLTGAEFNLYNVAENGPPISLVFVAEHEVTDDEGNVTKVPAYYRPATAEDTTTTDTITAGVATIKGLGAGTWYLEETKQPEGYNLLKGRTSVEVGEGKDWTATIIPGTEANGDTPATPATWDKGGVRVVNLTGAELPETGGIGTTIFYIVGGLLAVGAGVLLVTKKKMGSEEK